MKIDLEKTSPGRYIASLKLDALGETIHLAYIRDVRKFYQRKNAYYEIKYRNGSVAFSYDLKAVVSTLQNDIAITIERAQKAGDL